MLKTRAVEVEPSSGLDVGRATPNPETGSVAVAVMVVLLISILSLAVLARSQRSLASSNFGTEEAQAEAGAEQALAEATAVLANGQTGSFAGTGTLPEGSYRYEVVQTGSLDYEIYAEATVGDRTRAVVGTVGGDPAFAFTLFAAGTSSLDNGGTIDGVIITNGAMRVGAGKAGDVQFLHGSGASCAGCSDARVVDAEFELRTPSFEGVARQPCPVDGEFTGVVSGRSGRPVLCSARTGITDVSFTGTITVVDGPLIIEIGDGVTVDFVAADINVGGAATDLQIYAEGSSGLFTAESVRLDGLIAAPERTLTVAPLPGSTAATATAEVVGAIAIGDVSVTAGNSLSISTTNDLASFEPTGWELGSWEAVTPR